MERNTDRPAGGTVFATTRWTLVVAAGHKSSPDSAKALSELCEMYWYPLYLYVRRRARNREDAEDLTQAFFQHLLKADPWVGLDSHRGRFRAFLLASLKNFLANASDRAQREKRGGGAVHLSLDWADADRRFQVEAVDGGFGDAERAFDRAWAVEVLERVIRKLAEECESTGKAVLFDKAKACLQAGEDGVSYAELARELGMEIGTLRVAVHRLRKRYRELLREEISVTLSDAADLAEELRSLRAAVSG